MIHGRLPLFALLCAGVFALQTASDYRHVARARSAADLLTVYAGRGYYSESIVIETCLRGKPNCPPLMRKRASTNDLRWRPSMLIWCALFTMRNAWEAREPADALRLSRMAEVYADEALRLQGNEEYRAYAMTLRTATIRMREVLSQNKASPGDRRPDELIAAALSSYPPDSAVERSWGRPGWNAGGK